MSLIYLLSFSGWCPLKALLPRFVCLLSDLNDVPHAGNIDCCVASVPGCRRRAHCLLSTSVSEGQTTLAPYHCSALVQNAEQGHSVDTSVHSTFQRKVWFLFDRVVGHGGLVI